MNKKRILILFGIFAVIFSLPGAWAAGQYQGIRWALLNTRKVLESAAEITRDRYPDCDSAIVDQREVQLYRADGTGENQEETFRKILTGKGFDDVRTLTLYYNLPYTTVDVVKVEVFTPSGRVIPVDLAANSQEMIDDSQMDSNIYDPSQKELKVNIPQLEVGDVIHSVTRTTTHLSHIPGEFEDEVDFESEAYIRHFTYVVVAPAEKPLAHQVLRDAIPGTVRYLESFGEGQSVVHDWEVSNVPPIFVEPSMPGNSVGLQRLLISTTKDWQTISRWYWRICEPHLYVQTPEMQGLVQDLTEEAKSDLDKIKAIFYYVSNKIRYLGLTIETDRPGDEPHDVALTFTNKYGVCRDKAALLTAMLRLAGFEAYPVLTSYAAKKDPEVPSEDFDHVIVAVDQGQRSYLLMDPTDENTRVLLPASESEQSYLVARPDGETILVSPVVPPEDNMLKVKTQAYLRGNGQMEARSDINFNGYYDNDYRDRFSQMKPDDVRRFFADRLQAALPGAYLKSVNVLPELMSDHGENVRAQLEFTVDHVTASGSGKAVLKLPWIGESFSELSSLYDLTKLNKRKYPLRLESTWGIREDLTLKLAKDYSSFVALPQYQPISNSGIGLEREVSWEDRTIKASSEFKLKSVEFSPEEYPLLKLGLETLSQDLRQNLILAMVTPEAVEPEKAPPVQDLVPVKSDAVVLDQQNQLQVEDAHHGVYRVKYRKRVLSYIGTRNESEIKIPYNPSFQQARLVGARVISKDGRTQEITAKEINVLDEDWDAAAKRYTGGKILVANLPGVDVDSIIEVEYEVRSNGAPFLADFEPFQDFDEVRKKSFLITSPDGLRVQKLTSADTAIPGQKVVTVGGNIWDVWRTFSLGQSFVESVSREAGQQQFLWRSSKVPALSGEDNLPPDWFYRPGVIYFIGDSKDYWNELERLLLDRSRNSLRAAGLGIILAAQQKSRLDVVTAVRDYVYETIRESGPNFTELPLKQLSAADTTLADGYGHQADRAILLHAMLSAAGFAPEFVLGSSLLSVPSIGDVVQSFPLPNDFRDLLVRVVVDGKTYYLNDTDEYSQIGSTQHDGQWGLDLRDRSLALIKALPECRNKIESFWTLSVQDDGQVRVDVRAHYYGEKYAEKQLKYDGLSVQERIRAQCELADGVASFARPVGDLLTDFNSYPGLEKYTVEIPHYAVIQGDLMCLDLPLPSDLLPLNAGGQRTLPLQLSSSMETIIHEEVNLPPGFSKVDVGPKSETVDLPDGLGQLAITASLAPGKYLITYHLQTNSGILSAANYPIWLKKVEELEQRAARLLVLEP